MGAPIPQGPSAFPLSSSTTGAAVSAGHGRHIGSELAFLLGTNLPPVAAQRYPAIFLGGLSYSYPIVYVRSPGARALRIDVQLHKGSGTDNDAFIATTLSSGSVVWIEPPDNLLDGTHNIGTNVFDTVTQRTISGTLDVSAFTIGTAIDVILTISQAGGKSGSNGIRSVTLTEIPQAYCDPVTAPTTEIGVDPAWTIAPSPIHEGASNHAAGMQRIMGQLDAARSQVPLYWQVGRAEADTQAWAVVDTSGTPALIPWGLGGAEPQWRIRLPRIYKGVTYPSASVDQSLWIPRIRYKCSGANTGTLRITTTPVGGASTSYNLALTNRGTYGALAFSAIDLIPTGTDQETDIVVRCTTTAGTLYISQLSLTYSPG